MRVLVARAARASLGELVALRGALTTRPELLRRKPYARVHPVGRVGVRGLNGDLALEFAQRHHFCRFLVSYDLVDHGPDVDLKDGEREVRVGDGWEARDEWAEQLTQSGSE